MKYPNKIKSARLDAGLTQIELAKMVGITVQALQNYEYGLRDVRSSTLSKISGATGKPLSYLLGLDDDPSFTPLVERPVHRVPVVGRIAAGEAREAIQQADECHETRGELWSAHPHAFWLVVAGNSMNRLFPEGALVLVDPDMEVRDGDVGAVFVNGDDATVKRVFLEPGRVRLHPESHDPEYRDTVIREDDPDAPEFRAIGRVVSYTAPDGWRA
ncbi:MAG: LexA family protein [Coriobacteriales bacterium]